MNQTMAFVVEARPTTDARSTRNEFRSRLSMVGASAVGAFLFLLARGVVWGEPISRIDFVWFVVGAIPPLLPKLILARMRLSDERQISPTEWTWPLSLLLFLAAHEFLVSEILEAPARDHLPAVRYLCYAAIYVVPAGVCLLATDFAAHAKANSGAWSISMISALVFFCGALFII